MTLKTSLAVPTIHLNGTSKESLVTGLCDAAHAIQIAITALGQAAPNGRDYYPQDMRALQKAQDQHNARVLRLRSVYAELMEIAEAIDT